MSQDKLNNGEYFYSTYKYLKAYTYDEDQTYYTYNSSNKSYTKITSTLSQKEINKGIYYIANEIYEKEDKHFTESLTKTVEDSQKNIDSKKIKNLNINLVLHMMLMVMRLL